LSRSCALSCDNLISAEVVTASGEIVCCDSENHTDLFWAIRGGGGNFGVVTSFEFIAYPVKTVLGGPTIFHPSAEVMRNYEALISDAPEEFNAIFAIAFAPPAPFVPEEWHLKPVMIILTCWSGPESEDGGIPELVAACGDVIGQALWRMPYPEINMFFDELLPAGLRHYWKANSAMTFNDESIAAHIEHGLRVSNAESGMYLFPVNGACHRVDAEDNAYANRHTKMSAVVAGTWYEAEDDEAYTTWVRNYFEALKPHSEPGGYVNFMAGDDQGLIDSNYGPKFKRLQEIKAAYDPGNLFRVNQNIAP